MLCTMQDMPLLGAAAALLANADQLVAASFSLQCCCTCFGCLQPPAQVTIGDYCRYLRSLWLCHATQLPQNPLPAQVTIGDFSRYLHSVGERLEVLERSQEASQQRMQEALSPGACGCMVAHQLACLARMTTRTVHRAQACMPGGVKGVPSLAAMQCRMSCSVPSTRLAATAPCPALCIAEELKASQGQGLVAAMAEVPAPFFQEGFDIDQAALWEEVVQVGWRVD